MAAPFIFDSQHMNCVHFPDLAEIRAGYITGSEDLDSVPTEFMFTTTGTFAGSSTIANLHKLGLEEVGAGKNWHWIHHQEWTNPILLFFKRVHPDAKPFPKPDPRHFSAAHENISPYHNSEVKNLQLNGCGLKVGDCQLKRRSFYRYFCLMRMPVKPSKRQLRWLKYANYRRIAVGNLASFWVNGWENGADWSITKEKHFWLKRGIPWEEKSDFTYYFRHKNEKKQYKNGLRVAMRDAILSGKIKEPFSNYNLNGKVTSKMYSCNE